MNVVSLDDHRKAPRRPRPETVLRLEDAEGVGAHIVMFDGSGALVHANHKATELVDDEASLRAEAQSIAWAITATARRAAKGRNAGWKRRC